MNKGISSKQTDQKYYNKRFSQRASKLFLPTWSTVVLYVYDRCLMCVKILFYFIIELYFLILLRPRTIRCSLPFDNQLSAYLPSRFWQPDINMRGQPLLYVVEAKRRSTSFSILQGIESFTVELCGATLYAY